MMTAAAFAMNAWRREVALRSQPWKAQDCSKLIVWSTGGTLAGLPSAIGL